MLLPLPKLYSVVLYILCRIFSSITSEFYYVARQQVIIAFHIVLSHTAVAMELKIQHNDTVYSPKQWDYHNVIIIILRSHKFYDMNNDMNDSKE